MSNLEISHLADALMRLLPPLVLASAALLALPAARAADTPTLPAPPPAGRASRAAATYRALARRLVDHTLEFGEDKVNGGIFDGGEVYSNTPSAPDKVGWVQAEALNSLLLMHTHFGAEDPRYWAAFNRQWDFIQKRQIDSRVGGWYPAVQESGATIPGRAKSDGWTEGYHQGRALINVTADLRALAAKAGTL